MWAEFIAFPAVGVCVQFDGVANISEYDCVSI